MTQRLVIILISTFLIALAAGITAYNIIYKSIGYGGGLLKTKHVDSTVEIYENDNGIPHVMAANEDDLFFAIGYIHASKRLWQMDISRRTAQGNLSEIFGERTLLVDKYMRSLNISELSMSLYDNLSVHSKQILDRYTTGINFYINENIGRLPIEFSALGYQPEAWDARHSLQISRLFAYQMSFSFITDMTYGEIADKISYQKSMSLIPNFSFSVNSDFISPNDTISKLFTDVATSLHEVGDLLGHSVTGGASNCWAVSSPDSNMNSVILANDPHLALALPAVWLQMRVQSPTFDVFGLAIPGFPLFLIGRNNISAWGVTNLMLDDCDLFIEKTDSTGNYFFDDNNEKYAIRYLKDTIIIKNAEDHIYYKRFSRNSQIISDFHILKDHNVLFDKEIDSSAFYNNYAISFKWAGTEKSDETDFLYHLNKGSSFDELRLKADSWVSPALNFIVANSAGDKIQLQTGIVPNRQNNCNPNLPNPAWKSGYSWSGFYKPNEVYSVNGNNMPYLFAANQEIESHRNIFLSSHWENNSRYNRIENLLSSEGNYGLRDAQFMQNDLYSLFADDFIKKMLSIFEDYADLLDQFESYVVESLNNWDRILSVNSHEATIFNVLFTKFLKNTFVDELGERLYDQYCYLSNQPERKIMALMDDRNNEWFDNINTKEIENRDYILYISLQETIKWLKTEYQSEDILTWKYGKLHLLKLKHPFSGNDFLGSTVTPEALSLGGNNFTINKAQFDYSNPYEIRVGASARFITDLRDSLVLTSMPGGVSGDPLSPNYADQLRIWANGGYLKIPYTKRPGDMFELKLIISQGN